MVESTVTIWTAEAIELAQSYSLKFEPFPIFRQLLQNYEKSRIVMLGVTGLYLLPEMFSEDSLTIPLLNYIAKPNVLIHNRKHLEENIHDILMTIFTIPRYPKPTQLYYQDLISKELELTPNYALLLLIGIENYQKRRTRDPSWIPDIMLTEADSVPPWSELEEYFPKHRKHCARLAWAMGLRIRKIKSFRDLVTQAPDILFRDPLYLFFLYAAS